ncbi:uncharacterized protein LOC120602800 [Pteropus medius]|uniref:uncharacterized protein LOC120602800 n=1 Tax=Pteropus vampyrus TaxID=132908 RepID=UPI00196A553A|nr:uncharacterized protein LOC120602800 [Pteropus giganteus]
MKDPTPCSSTTSCREDAPQNGGRLARGAWQLLLLLLCSPGLVKFYARLLGLHVAMTNMASHCLAVYLLGLCILWYSSLQLGGRLTVILARKLFVDVLLPVQQALGQPLTIAWAWGLQTLVTLIHRAHCGILWLLRWKGGLALLSVAQWAYYSLVNFRHENSKALELLLRAVLQQVAVSLLVRCLERLLVAMGQVARVMQHSGLRPLEWARPCGAASKDLDAVTAILPATTVPLSQRFPGPNPAILSRLTLASISLCLRIRDKDASKGKGGCKFGATNMPIHTRFQSNRTSKMAFRSSKQALAQQVKATCVFIILLYIYAVSLFVQILK